MDNRPIGVMDSGIGGLSVVRQLKAQLPGESIMFIGDQGHFPYGTKTDETIQMFVQRIANYFVAHDVKLMVIACNTATAAALPLLRQTLPIPVIGVIEPGAQAALATGATQIGVIATDSTIHSGAYEQQLTHLNPAVQVTSLATQPLVRVVETGQTGTPAALSAVQTALAPLVNQPITALILGCTHFPFLTPEIQQVLGPQVTLVDPAIATVQAVQRHLEATQQLSNASQGHLMAYSTGELADLQRGFAKWLPGVTPQSCAELKLD